MAPLPIIPGARLPRNLLLERITPLLHKRQQTQSATPEIIPTTYGSLNSGPPPGTVVGIVLGSVAGVLLLLWLFYTCFTFGQRDDDVVEEVVVRDKRKRHSRASARSHRVSETVEVRRGPSPVRIVRPVVVPQPVRAERIIVEESRQVRREDMGGGSDEIVVIEDHDPPKRKKKKRQSGGGGGGDEGYRTVDPNNYGGVVGGRRR